MTAHTRHITIEVMDDNGCGEMMVFKPPIGDLSLTIDYLCEKYGLARRVPDTDHDLPQAGPDDE